MRHKNYHLGRLTFIAILAWIPIIWICLSACNAKGDENITVTEENKTIVVNVPGTQSILYVVTVDSCEYFFGYHNFAHKGNCKNPIHQNHCK